MHPRRFYRTVGCRIQGPLAAAALSLALTPGLAEASVTVKTRSDGRKVILNESKTQYSQRVSADLRPLAESSDLPQMIDYYAERQGLNPRLVQAVIQVESGYNERALSSKGAMGLMQLMPGTAKLMGVTNPYDPSQNIRGGTAYLRRQLDRFSGDLNLALAAYNAGPAAVTRHDGVPPYRETRNYVKKVLGLYRSSLSASPAQRRMAEPAGSEPRSEGPIVAAPPSGKKVYLRRSATGRIFFTTVPPKSP